MMNHETKGSRRRDGWVAALSGAAIGFLILLLLHPAGGTDGEPPVCYSTFGHVVPCGSGLAFGSALVGAVVVGASVYAAKRRRRRAETSSGSRSAAS
jgi:hypothetical protein